MDIDLNPDGPHSREHTAELGSLFDQCSKAIAYASMPDARGLESPADAYSLLGDLYSATGRFPQMCAQLEDFIRAQAATGRLYEAQGRDIGDQVATGAAHHLRPTLPTRLGRSPGRCNRSRQTSPGSG